MQKGLVSIITPMYKGAAFVGETIESVQAQTYTDWEMIIVDDCSPDDGAGIAVVKQYAEKDPRVRLIESKENRGSSGARNIALHAAKGQYIALLDSDDIWPENYLQSQLDLLDASPNHVIVYAAVQHIEEETKRWVSTPFYRPVKVNYNDVLKSCPITPSATVYDAAKCKKYYFNEDMGSLRDDFVYWLSMLKDVSYAHYNPDMYILYRVRLNAVTASKWKMIKPQWRVLREIEHLSLFKSIYCLFYWGVVGFIKVRIHFRDRKL